MADFNFYNLRMQNATHGDCLQAIRGQKIPKALGAKVTQRCVMRGIRYHPGFGVELYGLLPEFTRALNTRSIMSNQIRDINNDRPETFPTISGIRKPRYVGLFHELDLLRECHIAEEARENHHKAIYDAILRAEVKYHAMDDYTREIFDPIPGNLNGNTIIPLYHDIRFAIGYSPTLYTGIHWAMFPVSFELTEDGRMPSKVTLIDTCAYERPVVVQTERSCMIRGIYNNAIFAKWCSLQTDKHLQDAPIKAAINARFIMNGDLSRITADTPDAEIPYNISCPTIPLPCVLEELFRRQPKMKNAIARASILADYESVYDLVDANPDTILMRDACDSTNPHYLQDLEAKVLNVDAKT
ncbi:uncharacterized protein N7482_002393 [Penicillium canariense]|uniref:Uncharacterized protein n=1 Tax=Penicillium canariense TaxID=189055 RepID=A0A9W9ILP8_9EURO|nr:uncharacterized protein N7482_002393 [Penicillium canariense]KAJ5176516.1 hypothetical protein N7482_002393 [Penicillium canariense]